jgi:2-polyprenyl-3-methyl-5-hydroxy-6-metoxy-1,4-benzoquinol methylase
MRTEAYTFVRCDGCGVTYQNPQPTAESLQARYGGDYFSYEVENEDNFFNLMLLGLADIGFERLAGLESRGRFLDVGCATGRLLVHMRELGWKPQGVDLCGESARYASETRALEVFVGTLEQARFPSGSFRVVHFSHLLEHVREPRGFLGEVRRILTPDGYAVITTPNIDGLQARLLGNRWRSAIADHLYLFAPATLGSLLGAVGFEVERTVTWGGIAKGLAPRLVKAPLDRMAKRLGFGDVMMLLAVPR